MFWSILVTPHDLPLPVLPIIAEWFAKKSSIGKLILKPLYILDSPSTGKPLLWVPITNSSSLTLIILGTVLGFLLLQDKTYYF